MKIIQSTLSVILCFPNESQISVNMTITKYASGIAAIPIKANGTVTSEKEVGPGHHSPWQCIGNNPSSKGQYAAAIPIITNPGTIKNHACLAGLPTTLQNTITFQTGTNAAIAGCPALAYNDICETRLKKAKIIAATNSPGDNPNRNSNIFSVLNQLQITEKIWNLILSTQI